MADTVAYRTSWAGCRPKRATTRSFMNDISVIVPGG
jgi:hypothetical protein